MTSVAAFFDVDGTLVRANSISYYLFFVRHLCSPAQRSSKLLAMLLYGPYWFLLDRIDRRRFNRSFYRQYRGFSVAEIQGAAELCFRDVLMPRAIPETLRRAEEHRARGDRIVLVSGTLDFVLAPLGASLGAEAILCPTLSHTNGIYRGEIAGKNVVSDVKAEVVAEYAARHGVDLSQSYAYADSFSDVSLLRQVGHAVVVDPGRKLHAIAERCGWESIFTKAQPI